MIDQDDWSRLVRYAAGECTADEAEAVARWVGEAAERQEALAFIQDLGAAAEAGRPQWDTGTSWDRLAARRRARVHPPLRLIPLAAERRERPWRRRVAVVAAMLVATGALAAGWQLQRTAVTHRTALGHLSKTMREHVTRRAQRSTFELPDGSRITLAAASRLRYSPSLGGAQGPRDVYLEGQALFDVKHDERRPFLVHTAHGVTEDLGTRFTVQEYAGDTAVQVIVAEGSVELRAPGREGTGALLRPGQLGRLVRNGDAVVQSGIDLARHLAWARGQLVYDETPLRDALPELSRWYNVDFVLGDSAIGARHLTATFAGEAISETLTLLSSTLDVDYVRHGGTVTFLPRRPAR